MRVSDIMAREVRACSPEDSLATAAIRMWEGDCGFLPVVREGRVVGALTDRDIAMAVTLKGRAPAEMAVAEVMGSELYACSPRDSVAAVLETMAAHQVRRLPVVDQGGALRGVVSINDILLVARAKPGSAGAPGYYKVVAALQEISRHRLGPAVTGEEPVAPEEIGP